METRLPAIVILAWQRPESLLRLLDCVKKAHFGEGEIPLVLSVEGECAEAVRKVVEDFEWGHGPLRRIFHEKRLGLKEHILFCGDLTSEFGSVIVLEDDLLVSPGFYDFAVQAQAFFAQEDRVGGIALYHYHHSESDFQPFFPIHDGADHYFLQAACSWGQSWTHSQWSQFRQFLAQFPRMEDTPGYPAYLDGLADYSWKKHFSRYLHTTQRTFVYPRISLSTPFSEGGVSAQLGSFWQVPIALAVQQQFGFHGLDDSDSRYDGWYEWDRRVAKKYLGLTDHAEVTVNLRGMKTYESDHWVLQKGESKNAFQRFGLELQPLEMNVRLRNEGKGIILVRESVGISALESAKVPEIVSPSQPRLSIGILVEKESTSAEILKTLGSIRVQHPDRLEVVVGSLEPAVVVKDFGFRIRKVDVGGQKIGEKWVRLLEAMGNEWEMVVPAGVELEADAVDRILLAVEQFPHLRWVGGNRSGSVPRPLPQERWSKFLFQKRARGGLQLPLSAWHRNVRHQLSLPAIQNAQWPAGELWQQLLFRVPHHTLFHALASDGGSPFTSPPGWRPTQVFPNDLPLIARLSYLYFRANIPYLRSFFLEGGHLPSVLRWDVENQRWFLSLH